MQKGKDREESFFTAIMVQCTIQRTIVNLTNLIMHPTTHVVFVVSITNSIPDDGRNYKKYNTGAKIYKQNLMKYTRA